MSLVIHYVLCCFISTALHNFIFNEHFGLVKKMIIFNKGQSSQTMPTEFSTQHNMSSRINQKFKGQSLDLGHDIIHVYRDGNLLSRCNRGTGETKPEGGERETGCE